MRLGLTVWPAMTTLNAGEGGEPVTRVVVALSGGWPDATVRLPWHGNVLAACNLHVLLPGYPLPPLPTEEEFRELIG